MLAGSGDGRDGRAALERVRRATAQGFCKALGASLDAFDGGLLLGSWVGKGREGDGASSRQRGGVGHGPSHGALFARPGELAAQRTYQRARALAADVAARPVAAAARGAGARCWLRGRWRMDADSRGAHGCWCWLAGPGAGLVLVWCW